MKLVPEIFTNSNTLIVTQQQKLVFEDILGESDTTVVNCQCQRPKGLKSWVNNSRVTQYRVFYFILNHPHPQLRIGPMKILATNKVFLYLLGKRWFLKTATNMVRLKSILLCECFSWPCKVFVKGLKRYEEERHIYGQQ